MDTNVNYGYNESHPTATINDRGRKGKPRFKASEKSKAFELYKTGLLQKEISACVGVTEKTVGAWVKEWKQSTTLGNKSIINLKNRLFEASANPDTPTEALKNLVWCIQQLEKQ